MRAIFLILGLLLSTAVSANDLARMSPHERCKLWSTNAVHGVRQALRGAPRQIQYISEATLMEMVEHFGVVGIDKIYVLEDPDYTPQEREFLERSTLFGYDAILQWKARYKDDAPYLGEWMDHFMSLCTATNRI